MNDKDRTIINLRAESRQKGLDYLDALNLKDKEIADLRAELQAADKRIMTLEAERDYRPRMDAYEAVLAERDQLKAQLSELRPKADAYDGVCRSLRINKDILGFIDQLKAQLDRALQENSTEYLRGRADEQSARATVENAHIESLKAQLAEYKTALRSIAGEQMPGQTTGPMKEYQMRAVARAAMEEQKP